MSVGLRIRRSFDRPDCALVAAFCGISTPNIADNMNRLSCMDGGIRRLSGTTMCGVAFTVKCGGGDSLLMNKAINMAHAGDIIVVSGVDPGDRAFCGEMMVYYAKAKGIGGFVVDGYVRDIESIAQAGFPVYARGVNANGPLKCCAGEINFPIACGRQVVMPGDILVGDENGVVVVPQQDAAAVLTPARETFIAETAKLSDYREGKFNPKSREWIDRTLDAMRFVYID